jgi:hypothetical protein
VLHLRVRLEPLSLLEPLPLREHHQALRRVRRQVQLRAILPSTSP